MGRIGSPKTSVLNNLTPRNNPEDGGNSELYKFVIYFIIIITIIIIIII